MPRNRATWCWQVTHVDGETVYLKSRQGVRTELYGREIPGGIHPWRRLAAGYYVVVQVWRTAGGLDAGLIHIRRVRRTRADVARTQEALPFDTDSIRDDVVR